MRNTHPADSQIKSPGETQSSTRWYIPSGRDRVVARVIDVLIIMIWLGVIWVPLNDWLVDLGIKVDLLSVFSPGNPFITASVGIGFVLVSFIYELLSLSLFAASPGKILLGMKVAAFSDPNSCLTWRTILLRSISPNVARFLCLGCVGESIMLFNSNRRHAFDLLADSIVLQATPCKRPSVHWILGATFIMWFAGGSIIKIKHMELSDKNSTLPVRQATALR